MWGDGCLTTGNGRLHTADHADARFAADTQTAAVAPAAECDAGLHTPGKGHAT